MARFMPQLLYGLGEYPGMHSIGRDVDPGGLMDVLRGKNPVVPTGK